MSDVGIVNGLTVIDAFPSISLFYSITIKCDSGQQGKKGLPINKREKLNKSVYCAYEKVFFSINLYTLFSLSYLLSQVCLFKQPRHSVVGKQCKRTNLQRHQNINNDLIWSIWVIIVSEEKANWFLLFWIKKHKFPLFYPIL